MVLGLLALGAGAGAAAGWLAHERLQDPSVQKIPAKVCPASAELDKKRGYLHVLAHPWARVEVDGSVLGTTPFAEPLALPPGKHTVVLTNPYFEPVKRTVTIARGEVLRIVEVLKRSGAGPDLKKKSR